MLDPVLSQWLDAQAQALDLGHSDPQHVLSQLASANVLRIGVSPQLGGSGGCFFCTTRGLLHHVSYLLDIGGYFVSGGGLLFRCSGDLADLHGDIIYLLKNLL